MNNPTSTLIPGPDVLFGFPIPPLFLGLPTLHNNLVSPFSVNYLSPQQSARPEFSQITPVTSISEGWTGRLGGSMVGPKPGKKLVLRVESYLAGCELKAKTIEDREAYQIAQTVVRRAFEGCSDPYTLAFAWFYGGAPELILWKQAYYRAWVLGEPLPAKPVRVLAQSTQDVLPPKKPVVSVKVIEMEKQA